MTDTAAPAAIPETLTAEVLNPDLATGGELEPTSIGLDAHHEDETRNQAGDDAINEVTRQAFVDARYEGADRIVSLAVAARLLSMSDAAPKLVQGNPSLAFHMVMLGDDFGLSPAATMNMIYAIPSKGGLKLSLAPKLLNAQLRRLKIGTIVKVENTHERCVVMAFGPGGVDRRCRRILPVHHTDDCECDYLNTHEYTWADAQMQELADTRCTPTDHHQRCDCKDNWTTVPRRMVWWRAAGEICDDEFPEAQLGMYTAEVFSPVDADGRPLDPKTVRLPDGFEPPPVEMATEDDIEWVRSLFEAMAAKADPETGEVLKKEHPKRAMALKKFNERRNNRPVDAMTAREMGAVVKLLRSMIKDADEWIEGTKEQDEDDPTPEADTDVELDPDTGEVMAVSPNPSGTDPEPDPEPVPEPEAKPEQSAAEALSNRGKAVGIDEFTQICIDGGSTVSEVMNTVVQALAEMNLNYGTTYAKIVPLEPGIIGDAADLLQSGTIPTVETLVEAYKADETR